MSDNLHAEDIERILQFWFGQLDTDGFAAAEQKKLWWSGDDDLDLEISHKFSSLVQMALSHNLESWEDTPQGRLASVILLDQFTRNIFRGTEQAFSGDTNALRICKDGLKVQADLELSAEQQVFFYMPLEHSEDIDDQELCIRLLQGLEKRVPETKKETIQGYIKFAIEHKEIIQQFGRFPHRNKALNRENTPEEEDYLAGHHKSFGQG